MKNRYIIIAIVVYLLGFVGCTTPSTTKIALKKENIQGETMGTTFSISYLDSTGIDLMDALEFLLIDFNQSEPFINKQTAGLILQ